MAKTEIKSLSGAKLLDVEGTLRDANLRDANLGGANLRGADLRDANLGDADLRGASLRGANLRDAILGGANLGGANLKGANLRSANLRSANLRDASLRGANLRDANLGGANLGDANLRGADLRSANLGDADLGGADLGDADLGGANLGCADLRGANLSQAKGVESPSEWLSKNFEADELGVIVYRARNGQHSHPLSWVFAPEKFLEEMPNPDRGTLCSCGVAFGTQAWVRKEYSTRETWKCRIRWMDLASVIVPFGTDGKARCGRLELLGIVESKS